MTSLRSRLGTGLVLSLILMMGLLWILAVISVQQLMEAQLLTRLAHDGENLLGGLEPERGGTFSLDARRVQGIYQQPYSGHYFVITVGQQSLRSRSLWDATLPPTRVAVGETRVTRVTGPRQQPLLVWARGYRKQGRTVRIQVAEDLTHVQAGIRTLRGNLLLGSVVMVLLLWLVQRFLIHRSLDSVSVAAKEVARLEQGEIRSLPEQVPDEIRPLVQAINHLLRRQQQRMQRYRESLGNLAHAIKTPLTLLQQLARDETHGIDAPAREELLRYSTQISDLIDTALRRARLAGSSVGTRRFDVRQDLPVLVDTLQRLYRDKAIEFRQGINGVTTLPLEQQDGMELLGNLLDNAWKWARSRIRLDILKDEDGGIRISIEDDGPGVNASERKELARRGHRHDENRPGHGIGLSIVKGLVEELGGETGFTNSDLLGGLRVVIRLSSAAE
ncbi:MAG TPA: HAMP domain-containing protein [Chromatiales bacterium]|nr:HAMP domain-containing protein [Chromatiales bacterium]